MDCRGSAARRIEVTKARGVATGARAQDAGGVEDSWPSWVQADLAPTVEAMIREHGALRVAVEQLGQPSTGADAAMLADSIVMLFVAHVVKENELLLPRLLADRSVDLAQLLEQMHGPEVPSDVQLPE